MKRVTKWLFPFLMVLGIAVGFTSCDDDYPGPGPGSTFVDGDLTGTWQLWQANGINVTPGDVNYMRFSGNGNGRYYFMRDGRWYYEGISYWSKFYGSGDYQLNIQYANGSSASMIYWFTSQDDLFMRWTTYDGQNILYHYVYYTGPMP